MIIGDYSAVLDACVLHPVWLKGALLWMAEEGLYRPLWSDLILDEWQASLARRFPDKNPEDFASERLLISQEFSEALVTIPASWSPPQPSLLPDPKDDHVLMAAICGKADAIVTANLRDFPVEIVRQFGIEVRHPDDFLLDVITLDPKRAVAALQNHRQSLTRSQPDAEHYVERARACHLIQTHAKLQEYLGVL